MYSTLMNVAGYGACVGLGPDLMKPLGQIRCLPVYRPARRWASGPFRQRFWPGALYYFRRFNYGDGQKPVKDMIFDHRIGTQKVAALPTPAKAGV
jgi:hypothetical protein